MIILELFRRLASYLKLINTRQKTRKQLLELDQSQLKDIGISRVDALFEGQKNFWES